MILSELFTAHLRAPSRRDRGLVAALEGAGLELESAAYHAWCAGSREITADGAWFGHRVAIGGEPPAGKPGALWFDICELALMAYVGRAWIATRPTSRWQMRGFLAVSARSPYMVQIPPPFTVLDPARVAAGDELDRCTNLTAGEATLYTWWFGKMLPHQLDWQSAKQSLPEAAMRALWSASPKEWISTRLDQDEGVRLYMTSSTIDRDPVELIPSERALPDAQRVMLRGEHTRDPEIGMRSAVNVQIGLLTTISSWRSLALDIKLESLLDRSQFR